MIEDYLKGMIQLLQQNNTKKLYGYYNMEDFVFTHGQRFTIAQKYPHDIMPKGKMKECYYNATMMFMCTVTKKKEEKLYYCEGYAISNIGLPVLHGWCVNINNEVIDPTWIDGQEYFGIIFKSDYVLYHIQKYMKSGIIDNWEKGWPLFKEKVEKWKLN